MMLKDFRDLQKENDLRQSGLSEDSFATPDFLRTPLPVMKPGSLRSNAADMMNDFYANQKLDYTEEASDAGFGTDRRDKMIGLEALEDQDKDLEDYRARTQSNASKILNGTAKFVPVMGTTFADGIAGTIAGAFNTASYIGSSLASGDKITGRELFNAFVDNPVSQKLLSIQDAFEKIFPNYYTDEERNDEGKWWIHINANMIGDQFIKNLGFTAGAVLAGVVTSGVSRSIRSGGKSASNIIKAGAAANAGDASAEQGLRRMALNRGNNAAMLREGEKAAKNFRKTGIWDQVAGGIGGAVGEGRIEALHASREFYDEATRDLQSQYAAYVDSVDNDLFAEHPEWYDVDDNDNAVLVDPVGQLERQKRLSKAEQDYNSRMEYLDKQASIVANTVFALNIPLLAFDNTFEFGKLFGGGFNTLRKQMRRVSRAGGTYSGLGSVLGAHASGIANMAVEGFEEINQKVISEGAKDVAKKNMASFYNDGNDAKAIKNLGQWLASMVQSGADVYADPSSWEEFAIGALTGAIPMYNGHGKIGSADSWGGGFMTVKDRLRDMKTNADIAKRLNQYVNTGEFEDLVHAYIKNAHYAEVMADAAEVGNKFVYHNAESKSLINLVAAFHKAGRTADLEEFIDRFSSLSDADVQDVRDALEKNSGKNATEDLTDEKVRDYIKQRVDSLKKTVESYTKAYDSIAARVPVDTPEETLIEYAFTAAQLDNFDDRFFSIWEGTADKPGVRTRLRDFFTVEAANAVDSDGHHLSAEKQAEMVNDRMAGVEEFLRGSNDISIRSGAARDALSSARLMQILSNIKNRLEKKGVLKEGKKDDNNVTPQKELLDDVKDMISLVAARKNYYRAIADPTHNIITGFKKDKKSKEKTREEALDLAARDRAASLPDPQNIQELKAMINDPNLSPDARKKKSSALLSKDTPVTKLYKKMRQTTDTLKQSARSMFKGTLSMDVRALLENVFNQDGVVDLPSLYDYEYPDAMNPQEFLKILQQYNPAMNENLTGKKLEDYDDAEVMTRYDAARKAYNTVINAAKRGNKVEGVQDEYGQPVTQEEKVTEPAKPAPTPEPKAEDLEEPAAPQETPEPEEPTVTPEPAPAPAAPVEEAPQETTPAIPAEEPAEEEFIEGVEEYGGKKFPKSFTIKKDADGYTKVSVKHRGRSKSRKTFKDLYAAGITKQDLGKEEWDETASDGNKWDDVFGDWVEPKTGETDTPSVGVEKVVIRPDGSVSVELAVTTKEGTDTLELSPEQGGDPGKVLSVLAPNLATKLGLRQVAPAVEPWVGTGQAQENPEAGDVEKQDAQVGLSYDRAEKDAEREGHRAKLQTSDDTKRDTQGKTLYEESAIPEIAVEPASEARGGNVLTRLISFATAAWNKLLQQQKTGKKVEGAGDYRQIYDKIEFDFVNKGHLRRGSEITFSIYPDSFYTNGKDTKTVFMTYGNHVVGVLRDAGSTYQGKEIYGHRALHDAIKKEYETWKKKHNPETEIFTFSKPSKVWRVRKGRIQFSAEERVLGDSLPGYDRTAPIVYNSSQNGWIPIRASKYDEEQIRKMRDSSAVKAGGLYYFVRNSDGTFIPVRLTLAHFNDSEAVGQKGSSVYNAVYDMFKEMFDDKALWDTSTKEKKQASNDAVLAVKQAIGNYIYTGNLGFSFGTTKEGDATFRIYTRALDERGEVIRTEGGKEKMEVLAEFSLNNEDGTPKTSEDLATTAIVAIQTKINPQIQLNMSDRASAYKTMLSFIEEGYVTTNVDSLSVVGSSFYIDPYDPVTGDFMPVFKETRTVDTASSDSSKQAKQQKAEQEKAEAQQLRDDHSVELREILERKRSRLTTVTDASFNDPTVVSPENRTRLLTAARELQQQVQEGDSITKQLNTVQEVMNMAYELGVMPESVRNLIRMVYDDMKADGIVIEDLYGKDYNPRSDVSHITRSVHYPKDVSIISRVIKPLIKDKNGKVIQQGVIEISVGDGTQQMLRRRADIKFEDANHTYTRVADGKQLEGVTTVMANQGVGVDYSQVGNGDPVKRRQILAKAAAKGTAIHEAIQDYDDGIDRGEDGSYTGNKTRTVEAIDKETGEDYGPVTVNVTSAVNAYRKIGLPVIASEYLVSDGENFASMIDKVMRVDENTVDLADLKTTSTLHEDALRTQLSIYAYLFERQNPGVKVRNLHGVHIQKNGTATLVTVDRLSDTEVAKILNAEKARLAGTPEIATGPVQQDSEEEAFPDASTEQQADILIKASTRQFKGFSNGVEEVGWFNQDTFPYVCLERNGKHYMLTFEPRNNDTELHASLFLRQDTPAEGKTVGKYYSVSGYDNYLDALETALKEYIPVSFIKDLTAFMKQSDHYNTWPAFATKLRDKYGIYYLNETLLGTKYEASDPWINALKDLLAIPHSNTTVQSVDDSEGPVGYEAEDDDYYDGLGEPADYMSTKQAGRHKNKIDLEAELAWLDKVLPNISAQQRLQIKEGLINMANADGYAYGMVQRGMMTLSKDAVEGTTYHEAFHWVMQYVLSDAERSNVYKEARRIFGTTSAKVLEENLADAFREWKLGGAALSVGDYLKGSFNDRSLFQGIAEFFRRLFVMVTNYNRLMPQTMAVYQKLNAGEYANRPENIAETGSHTIVDDNIEAAVKKVNAYKNPHFVQSIDYEIQPDGTGKITYATPKGHLISQHDFAFPKDKIDEAIAAVKDLYAHGLGLDLTNGADSIYYSDEEGFVFSTVLPNPIESQGETLAAFYDALGNTGMNFEYLSDQAKQELKEQGYTEEKYDNTSQAEKEHIIKCLGV